MAARKTVGIVGKPKVNGTADERSIGVATSPRRGRGGPHGIPSGFYARTADPEAKQQAEEMREYFRSMLRLLLDRRGMTQAELARAMGVGLGTIKDKLAGRSSIDIGEANQMAFILGVKLHLLISPDIPASELFQLKPPYPTDSCFSPTPLGKVVTEGGWIGDPNCLAVLRYR